MLRKFLRWVIGVSGIVFMVIGLLLYPDDFLTGFMLGCSGALMAGLSLGYFDGE